MSAVGYNSAGNEMMNQLGGCSSCAMHTGGAKAKRKPTAYNQFVKKEMKSLKQQYPSKKVTELIKMVAAKWREQKQATEKKSKSRSSRSSK